MIYTGIGSRKTPESMQYIMTMFAYSIKGTLRSGGAKGADTAFEIGSPSKEIYLPKKHFNGNQSPLVVTEFENFKEISEIAEAIHPNWDACDEYARLLHSRNVCQILGKDLDKPSDLVVCWTPDGANNRDADVSRLTGGTGTAINLAKQFDILVLNLYNQSDLQHAIDLARDKNFESNFTSLCDTLQPYVLEECLDMLKSVGM